MSATLHLARFTPAGAARTLGRMWRGRETLAATPGLATVRVFMLADLDPVAGGRPRPLRYGLFCGWDGDQARDAFRPGPFTRDAEEVWGLSLETVRVGKGRIDGWVPATDGVPRFERDEPLLVMTHGRLRPRYVPRFTVDNLRIVRAMTGSAGLEMMTGAADHPLTRATFSLWRSQGDAVRFAYEPRGLHGPVQRQSLAVPWMDEFFFARFRPVASTGTWLGRDPLAPSSS